jgi:glycine oxidase
VASIGIAGAGLLGRLLAWQLCRLGHRVAVFDLAAGSAPMFAGRHARSDTGSGPSSLASPALRTAYPQHAAAFTAAGMLCPLAELDNAEPATAVLGWRSIALWRAFVTQLPGTPFFSERGSLLLAHRQDRAIADRVLARMAHGMQSPTWQATGMADKPSALSMAQLAALEPCVQGAAHAWLLPGEAQIDAVTTMAALYDGANNVQWHWREPVLSVAPGCLHTNQGGQRFDWTFDVRGTGAAPDMPVRGVRGEVVWLHAPGLHLQRPVRLLHPRHKVYIVPRPGNVVLVGASEIESEDRSPMSLRSAVELMAAAHSMVPALAEARIIRMDTNLRPALPDNAPRVDIAQGLVSINGLFRHGWLLAPALVEQALHQTGLSQAEVQRDIGQQEVLA